MQPNIKLSGLADEASPDLAVQLAVHRELGWQEIEPRSLGGKTLCRLSGQEVRDLAQQIRDSGLHASVIASGIGNWATPISTPFAGEEEKAKRLFSCMHALGSKYMRIMSYPNDGWEEGRWKDEVLRRIGTLTELAEKADLVLVHENCSGWAGKSYARTLELLNAINSPSLKLLFDIGNGVPHGYSPVQFLQQVIEHVVHVHIKDGVNAGGDTQYSMPGRGDAGVSACIGLLKAHGYRGIYAIEPHLQFMPHVSYQGQESNLLSSYIAYGKASQTLLEQVYG
ncbi:sugar phosphate isomerase/epimerase [Thalassomonas viridans]|uniref:Sugar phosphate isomerase/epimerase n=1 Tax=Thalassomonas viridans TaxID=137584 RepID=A0AAE9ZAX6_9GAMM|nr:sugar phosphate isomerase/epimerase family protein [Thalassomonas viridans]WDE08989.1 sugar phosphate isomerase/epimerase [Thalassomonas viridans]